MNHDIKDRLLNLYRVKSQLNIQLLNRIGSEISTLEYGEGISFNLLILKNIINDKEVTLNKLLKEINELENQLKQNGHN
jgi:hypothetical protein